MFRPVIPAGEHIDISVNEPRPVAQLLQAVVTRIKPRTHQRTAIWALSLQLADQGRAQRMHCRFYAASQWPRNMFRANTDPRQGSFGIPLTRRVDLVGDCRQAEPHRNCRALGNVY